MATYTVEVSTWNELVTMLSRACFVDSEYGWGNSDGVTIKLTADIDMNDELPTGYSNVFDYTRNGDGTYIMIDGEYTDAVTGTKKNHVIKNLRTPTQGTGTIFAFTHDTSYVYNFYRAVYVRNLDFQNVLLLSGHMFDWDNTKLTNIHFQFDNCRFTGQRGNYYWCNKNFATVINSCYFDLPWTGVGQSNLAYTSLIPKDDSNATGAVANYCRFKESYGNWEYSTVTNAYGHSSPAMFSFSYFKVSGCRIEGNMTLPRGEYIDSQGYTRYGMYAKLLGKPTANSYTPASQNVFDVKLTLGTNNYQSGDTVNVSGWSGVVKKDAVRYDGETAFNDYIYVQGSSDYGGAITPIFATPAQMKDASYLNGQGFDIIVPSE